MNPSFVSFYLKKFKWVVCIFWIFNPITAFFNELSLVDFPIGWKYLKFNNIFLHIYFSTFTTFIGKWLFHCNPAGKRVNFGNAVLIGGNIYPSKIVVGEIEYPLVTRIGWYWHLVMGCNCAVFYQFSFKIDPEHPDRTVERIFKGYGYTIRTGWTGTPVWLRVKIKGTVRSLYGVYIVIYIITDFFPISSE